MGHYVYVLKGDVNLDNKWQSDDLFQPILSNFKDIVIYLKNLLTFEYRQNSLIPLSMVVGVSDTSAICQQEWPIFYAATIKYLCRSCGKRKNVTFFLLDVLLYPNEPIYNT